MKNLNILFACFLFLFLNYSCQQPTTNTTTGQEQPGQQAQKEPTEEEKEDQLKDRYRELVGLIESGNTQNLDQYVAADAVDHGLDTNITKKQGVEGLRDFVTAFHSAFTEVVMNVEHVVADDDLVIAHGTIQAKQTGAFQGLPATGKSIKVDFVDIVRYENGMAVEHWEVMDNLAMLQQLGALGAPGAAASKK